MLIRVGFLLTTICGLMLGFTGFMQAHRFRAPLSDLAYWDLQLFTLDSDGLQDIPLNTELQIARFLVPLATFYAIAELAVHLFAGRARAWQVRRRWSGHAIVCGEGMQAELLAERLLASGEKVVAIQRVEQVRRSRRYFQLEADPQSPSTLRAASVERAKTVYALSDDTSVNLSTAMAAQTTPRRDGAFATSYVWVADPELCHALRARRLGLERAINSRVDFICPAELAARALAAERATTPLRHVLIVGFNAFSRSLLVELTRLQRLLPGAGTASLTVVDSDASQTMRKLRISYPFLARWTVRAIDTASGKFDVSTWAERLPADSLPDQTYLCGPEPATALRGALTAVPLWHGRPRSLVVCLDHSLNYGEFFHPDAEPLLDGLGGVLQIFGITEAACRSEFDGTDMIELLARSLHERYVAAQNQNGRRGPALVHWRELPARYRRSNQEQAAHIGEKLRAIGLLAAPVSGASGTFSFTREQIEELARMEHRRWWAERRSVGWHYGEERDENELTHPSMIEWEELSENEREKDREFVRALPDLLADAGLRLVPPSERHSPQTVP